MNIKDLLKDAYREGMSVEDIEKALAGIEMPNDGSAEIERLTKALSKSNSEAAEYKRQLREKSTDEEAKAREDAERMEDLQSKYDALLRESTVSKHKARFLALGYEESLATETAEAMVSGDTEKVFAAQKKHLDSVEKKIREDALKGTPRPTGGNSSETITKEQFDKMGYSERLKVYQDNPDIYKEFTGGN